MNNKLACCNKKVFKSIAWEVFQEKFLFCWKANKNMRKLVQFPKRYKLPFYIKRQKGLYLPSLVLLSVHLLVDGSTSAEAAAPVRDGQGFSFVQPTRPDCAASSWGQMQLLLEQVDGAISGTISNTNESIKESKLYLERQKNKINL